MYAFTNDNYVLTTGTFYNVMLLLLFHNRDTYWIIKGLLVCGMNDTARGMIKNLAQLIDQLVAAID